MVALRLDSVNNSAPPPHEKSCVRACIVNIVKYNTPDTKQTDF